MKKLEFIIPDESTERLRKQIFEDIVRQTYEKLWPEGDALISIHFKDIDREIVL